MTDDDLADGIGPTPPPVRIRKERGSFKPWHKPRKQAIRWEHLHYLAIRAFNNKAKDRRDEIKYLGLPGSDFLDIRSLLRLPSKKIGGANPNIFFVGFDTADEADGIDNVEEVDIKANPRVSSASRIIRSDIRSLSSRAAVSKLSVDDYAPYDVVNLDLCDSVLADDINSRHSIYHAIEEIFKTQRGAVRGWGLILTTRIDRSSIGLSALRQMQKLINESGVDIDDFLSSYERKLECSIDDSFSCDNIEFRQGLMVALLVWLASIAQSENLSVKFRTPHVYSVYNEGDPAGVEDMASLAFYFKKEDVPLALFPGDGAAAVDLACGPRGKGNEMGASNNIGSDNHFSLEAIEQVSNRVNVDREFLQDKSWLNACLEETRLLLEEAGLEVAGYDEWAISHLDEPANGSGS